MKQIIISSLYLIVLFCLSTFLFHPANLYWEIWWLDIPMHIMGGFGIAFLTGAIFSYKGKKVSYKRLFVVYVIAAILWEIYEYTHGYVSYSDWAGRLDSLKDFIDGLIGMSIAYLFIRK